MVQVAEVAVPVLEGTDHVELWVGNARQAAYHYRKAFGFDVIAYAGPETGIRDRASYVLQQGKVRLVLTAPLQPEGDIADHLRLHGDGVRTIALRVADATASPYLALAMLVQAGLDGIRRDLHIEQTTPRALPKSLGEALTLLEGCAAAREWLGDNVLSAYVLFKRAEIRGLEDLDESEICRRYAEVY